MIWKHDHYFQSSIYGSIDRLRDQQGAYFLWPADAEQAGRDLFYNKYLSSDVLGVIIGDKKNSAIIHPKKKLQTIIAVVATHQIVPPSDAIRMYVFIFES